MAAKILDLDLSEPLPSVWGLDRYETLHILLRFRGAVLGWATVNRPEGQSALTADRLRESLVSAGAWPLSQALLKEQLTARVPSPELPPISVVVCSQGRPSQLGACLSSLRSSGYPRYEIIVADCFPGHESTAATAARFGATYVRTDRPGIDLARNRGVDQTRYDILAFTVDRAQPDRRWLDQIGRMFLDRDVKAVTGLAAPAELDTVAQYHREFTYGFGYKLHPTIFEPSQLTDAERLWARHFGSGANMAIQRGLFIHLGGFDPGLSLEPYGDGAGDLELLHRLVSQGHALHYQPGAVVWLAHDRSDEALNRRLYENGRYFGAYLLTCAHNRTSSRLTILKLFIRSWLYARLLKRLVKPHGTPRRLVFHELRGTLSAPLAYRKARAFARSLEDVRSQNVVPATSISMRMPAAHPPPTPTIQPSAPLPGAIPIRVIRTWYPHWGQYAGMNQYLKYLNRQTFHVLEELVQENDNDFPIRHPLVRDWLRHRVQRHGMAWYNLSDLAAELRTLPDYLRASRVELLHYLDGEHSAQYLPPRRLTGSRPATVVTYHQPPDVLARVVRIDVARGFDCITVVAPEQEEFFRTQIGSARVRVILHGIDTEYYHPSAPADSSTTVTCVTVGHNYRDYRAVRSVAERLQTVKGLEFHVVSPRATGVEDLANVRCHRGLTDDQLVALYQRADILFLPLTKATANNTLLEGMACGLPVLSTSLPSIHAYTTPSAAILVDRNDPSRFADAIMHLVENPWARKTMAIEARKKAEELDWRNIAPLFESLYTELLAR